MNDALKNTVPAKAPDICPCGTDRPYRQCCGPFHDGTALPETAEQLMRSRYSAFALHKADYLTDTLHASKRQNDSVAALTAGFGRYHWNRLQVTQCEQGGAQDTKGTVTFAAHYTDNDTRQPGVLVEKSRFIKEAGRWFYVDGEQKLGRNDPCWCGSGKKYKKCHGA